MSSYQVIDAKFTGVLSRIWTRPAESISYGGIQYPYLLFGYIYFFFA